MMITIGRVGYIELKVPRDSYWSFFNSPYPGHKEGTAVDVYYTDHALFPLEEGKVIEVRRLPIKGDYLIVIKSGKLCLKVLHVAPSVSEGETIVLGDPIGIPIRSNFFCPWTDNHAHYEIRNCDDPYRARGGIQITPIVLRAVKATNTGEFEVVERTDNYCLARPLKPKEKQLTPVISKGFPIEGGIPHYGYFGAFGNVKELDIFGIRLTREALLKNGVSVFNVRDLVLPIKGVGIYCNYKFVKLLGRFEEGAVIRICGAGTGI